MKLKNLSVKEKIGQMLCFAFHGQEYNLQLKTLIEDHKIGNIIHFARNIANIDQVKALNAEMVQHSLYPLFIGLDQEGGMVRRVDKGVTYLPGAMSLAAGNIENIYTINKKVGAELKALGFNINYAPVADINNNPNNPVINSRSYGDDPYFVSQCVNYAFNGMQDANLLPTLKHFPGHGDTSVDSHIGLPVVSKIKAEIYSLELIPYIDAIKNGAEGIMMSHILYSKIDPDFPSSLSYEIITNLLKKELGYQGLITTDSLTMGAIWKEFSIEEIVLNGVNAGNDILVFCGKADLSEQIEIIKTFEKLVKENKITIKRIDESVEKIIKLKEKYCKPKAIQVDGISSVDLVKDAITKIEKDVLLPISKDEQVIVISPKTMLPNLVDNEEDEYTTLGQYLNCKEIFIDKDNNKFNEIVEKTKKYDKIILATYNVEKGDYQEKLFKLLDKDKTIVVALRSPYDIKHLQDVKTYICTYDYTKESLKILSAKLYSNDFVGKLPVNIMGG